MFDLIIGFIVAGVLMVAEYLLCTKLKSSLGRNYTLTYSWGNNLCLCFW